MRIKDFFKGIIIAGALSLAVQSPDTAEATQLTGQVISQQSVLTVFGPSSGVGIWGAPGTPAAAIQDLHYLINYNYNGSNGAGNQFTLNLNSGSYLLTGAGTASQLSLQEANVQGIAPHLLAIANSDWTNSIGGSLTPTNQINLANVLTATSPTPGGIVDRNFFDNGGGHFSIVSTPANANGTALIVAGSPNGSILFNHLGAMQGFGTNNYMYIQYLSENIINNVIYRDFSFVSWAQSYANSGLIAQMDVNAVIRFNVGTTGSNPIPEPATLALLASGTIPLVRRRLKAKR
jgi:hypothetical protein